MSGPHDVRLTQGHVLRHAPAQSPQGRDAAVIQLLVDEINGTRLGPFTYGIDSRRNRHTITYQSELGPHPTGPIQSTGGSRLVGCATSTTRRSAC